MGYGGTGRLREVEAIELSKCEYISILFAHLNRVVIIWRSIRDMNGLLSHQRVCSFDATVVCIGKILVILLTRGYYIYQQWKCGIRLIVRFNWKKCRLVIMVVVGLIILCKFKAIEMLLGQPK